MDRAVGRQHRRHDGLHAAPDTLRHRLRLRYRALRRNSRRWLDAHPGIDRLLHVTGALRTGVGPVARGVAVGLFVALTPTIGAQTLLIVLGCMLLRGNFPAAFTVSWISNPLTVPALYWLFHGTGAMAASLTGIDAPQQVSDGLFGLGDEIAITAVGSMLIATPIAMAGYVMTPRVDAMFRRRR